MAKSSTVATNHRSQDQPPSKSDESLPRSFKTLQRNVARFQKSQSKSKPSSKSRKPDLPTRKIGENFFQFVHRVNEIQDENTRSKNVMPSSASSSTKRYREKRKERILKKNNRNKSEPTAPSDVAKFNEVSDAPPKITQVPKKKQTNSNSTTHKDRPVVSAEDQLPVLISERRKDLERERMRQAYKQAKEARQRALGGNELIDEIQLPDV